MSYKRSRAAFEADISLQKSPYVFFGTPLPPLDPEVRDDGSYVPVWKQEVKDERGRKRLHGAFTGGWSAGYFNTVGSKEGWTPSTFSSSRTNRRKDDPKAEKQRPEDFMDEEDLADAEESRKIKTNDAFAGLGSTGIDPNRATGLMGLFRAVGETTGTKLLQKMGWREGQGVGPKVRRSARLDMKTDSDHDVHLFAPENVSMVSLERKVDWKGLGYEGEARLTPMGPPPKSSRTGPLRFESEGEGDDKESKTFGRSRIPGAAGKKNNNKGAKGSIGIGILNDSESDDDDPFELGPRISYNRVIVGSKSKKKKKKMKAAVAINPALSNKPSFLPRKAGLDKVGLGVRKCYDGRFPLDGFVFGENVDVRVFPIDEGPKYSPPAVPPNWKSSKQPNNASGGSAYVSRAEAARASKLDPKLRAALLGENQLPGKSVFNFMSPAQRERLVAATGKADLPPARGEVPAGYALSEEDRLRDLMQKIPQLDKATAVGALSRGASGGAPYVDDEAKRSRYLGFLEYHAGLTKSLPSKPANANEEEWLREFREFVSCANMFKPMTGFMASRFITSSSTSQPVTTFTEGKTQEGMLTKPVPKAQDPAEEAAKMGMYGPMTRSVADFYPSRLLCKRFGIKPPATVQPDGADMSASSNVDGAPQSMYPQLDGLGGMSWKLLNEERVHAGSETVRGHGNQPAVEGNAALPLAPQSEAVVVDSSRNEALEGKRAGEEVFKSIFGDSEDDE